MLSIVYKNQLWLLKKFWSHLTTGYFYKTLIRFIQNELECANVEILVRIYFVDFDVWCDAQCWSFKLKLVAGGAWRSSDSDLSKLMDLAEQWCWESKSIFKKHKCVCVTSKTLSSWPTQIRDEETKVMDH